MPNDGTLTTTTPDGVSTTRPVPPSWASVAPLLDWWKLALLPRTDGRWVVQTMLRTGVPLASPAVPFAALPQAIADVAARCEAGAGEGER